MSDIQTINIPPTTPTGRGHIGQDVQELLRFISLIQPPDIKEQIKGQIKTLNAQANAAVFVGAIQSQLLKEDHSTNLKIATNILFLVGILFNVIGAYFALMASSDLETDLNSILAEVKKLKNNKQKDEILRQLSIFSSKFVDPNYNDGGDGTSRGSNPYNVVDLERLCQSIRRNRYAGRLGSFAIALGFISCPAALGCLAWDHESLAMKIAAPAVAGTLVALRLVCYFIYRSRTDSLC